MNKRSDPIVLAERQVAEERTAALAEYQAARVKLRRHISSPIFIGGVLLGGRIVAIWTLAGDDEVFGKDLFNVIKEGRGLGAT